MNPGSYFSSKNLSELQALISNIVFKGKVAEEDIFLTENGRSAMYLILKSLNLPAGSKVLVQPFTCNSAISPVIWNSLAPKYVDIDYETLNMSPSKCREAIESDDSIRAIIIQHTFGRASETLGDLDYIRSKGIFVIEDCAHSLGVTYNSGVLGNFGDAAILSFGLEKVLPTKVGGAAIINNPELLDSFNKVYKDTKKTSLLRSKIWILNPFIRIFTRKMGSFGGAIISLLQKIGLFSIGFTKGESIGQKPSYYPSRMSNVIARIITDYITDLDEIIFERITQSDAYFEFSRSKTKRTYETQKEIAGTPYLKFPIYFSDKSSRDDHILRLRESGFYISNWYDSVIYPRDTELSSYSYTIGECPNAEKASDCVLNLPTGEAYSANIYDHLA